MEPRADRNILSSGLDPRKVACRASRSLRPRQALGWSDTAAVSCLLRLGPVHRSGTLPFLNPIVVQAYLSVETGTFYIATAGALPTRSCTGLASNLPRHRKVQERDGWHWMGCPARQLAQRDVTVRTRLVMSECLLTVVTPYKCCRRCTRGVGVAMCTDQRPWPSWLS